MIKHYIGKIDERVGELEFSTTIRFRTQGCPDAYLDNIAKSWRLDDAEWSEDYGGYDHGSGIAVSGGRWVEVSCETFEGVSEIITEL